MTTLNADERQPILDRYPNAKTYIEALEMELSATRADRDRWKAGRWHASVTDDGGLVLTLHTPIGNRDIEFGVEDWPLVVAETDDSREIPVAELVLNNGRDFVALVNALEPKGGTA